MWIKATDQEKPPKDRYVPVWCRGKDGYEWMEPEAGYCPPYGWSYRSSYSTYSFNNDTEVIAWWHEDRDFSIPDYKGDIDIEHK